MYDAVLLVSFGGPEGPDDVLPFLHEVTRGRGVPDARLAEVAEQYARFGGRSPLNDQCRLLRSAVEDLLVEQGPALPVYWGNRNWHPFLADTVRQMADDGITRAAAFVTSAFGSYSGCRQYQDDLARARDAVGAGAPVLDKLRLYYNHPGFLEPMAHNVRRALGQMAPHQRQGARVVFTAHSIPTSMASMSPYVGQLREAAGLVAGLAGLGPGQAWDVVFQSRSGPPQVPWLEPDIADHLRSLRRSGTDAVVVVPLGFTSDHMEVLYDLDTQAAAVADDLGLTLVRAATVGADPAFVAMIRELVLERMDRRPPRALGLAGPWPDECPADHCPAPVRQRPS